MARRGAEAVRYSNLAILLGLFRPRGARQYGGKHACGSANSVKVVRVLAPAAPEVRTVLVLAVIAAVAVVVLAVVAFTSGLSVAAVGVECVDTDLGESLHVILRDESLALACEWQVVVCTLGAAISRKVVAAESLEGSLKLLLGLVLARAHMGLGLNRCAQGK